MLVNVKSDIYMTRGLHFKVTDFVECEARPISSFIRILTSLRQVLCTTMEFFLNLFTEFIEFRDKKYM